MVGFLLLRIWGEWQQKNAQAARFSYGWIREDDMACSSGWHEMLSGIKGRLTSRPV